MPVIVRHHGFILTYEWLASRNVSTSDDTRLYETLVDAGEEDIPVLERMANVIEVTPAKPGVFYGDDGTVTIYEDGSWSVPDMEEE